MSDASVQIDLQNVITRLGARLGAQIGELTAELATANEALEVQQKRIAELAAKVPPEGESA